MAAAWSQTPLITVRFANPQNDCATGTYCLDAEFKADIPDQEVFGVNVRFFYDDQLLELVEFTDYQGGYGAAAPDPPTITTSEPAGPALFNFGGPADFVNGAIQLINTGVPPIYLDTENYTKLFQVCFSLDGPIANLDTFCPPVVWDLEQDPANGGFLSGDDGVVITVVDPDPNNESLAADENVEQFNWQYTGNGTPPYGEPIEEICSNVNCALPSTLAYFKGQRVSGVHVLEWGAVEEINLKGYQIQRSINKMDWFSIGNVDAQASSALSAYSFKDSNPLPGFNFYRLLKEDWDGRFTYSPIISVEAPFELAPVSLKIAPNPVSEGFVEISVPGLNGPSGIIRFFDFSGRLVLSEPAGQGIIQIPVSHLAAGVYTVSLLFPDIQYVGKVAILR